jgi:hypothetical protein
MRRTPPPTTADRAVERLPDTSCRSHISEQPRPDMRADTRPPVQTVTFGYDAIRCT